MLCIVKNSLELIPKLDRRLIDMQIVEVDDSEESLFEKLLPAYEKLVGAKKMYVAYYGKKKDEVCEFAKRGMHIIIKKKGRTLDGTDMDCCP